MKNLSIFFTVIVACLNSFGQGWFGRQEYFVDSCLLTTGKQTFNNPGYLMAGYRLTRPAFSSVGDFVIYKTDLNGQFSGPTDFTMQYSFFNGCTQSTPNNCSGVSVVESQGTFLNKAYALAAQYDAGIAFGAIDLQGNITQQLFFDFPSVNYSYNLKPTIRESVFTPDIFYVCGNWRFDSTFVMKIDASVQPPNPVWCNYYSINSGIVSNDLIESPYTNDELIVVGRCEIPPSTRTAADAFFMKLSSINGAVVTFSTYNKAWDGDEIFNSIEIADSPNMGSNGYVLGGKCDYSNVPPCPLTATCSRPRNRSFNQWVCKLDRNGAVLWSSLIEPNTGATFTTAAPGWAGGIPPGHDISRVWERQNPISASYEYFGISTQYCWPSAIAGGTYTARNHVGAFKLDDNGSNAISPNEFHYRGGPPSPIEDLHRPQIAGLETGGGSDDGLRLFSSDSTDHNFIFLKTYFNGVAGCTDTVINMDNVYPGPDSVSTAIIQVDPFFRGCPLFQITPFQVSTGATTICSSSSVASGSNAKGILSLHDQKKLYAEFNIAPNPTTDLLRIQSKESLNNVSDYSVLDCLGRTLYQSPVKKSVRDTTIEINCKALGFPPGIYFIQLRFTTGDIHQFKFIFQND